jgi:hypothetical protein
MILLGIFIYLILKSVSINYGVKSVIHSDFPSSYLCPRSCIKLSLQSHHTPLSSPTVPLSLVLGDLDSFEEYWSDVLCSTIEIYKFDPTVRFEFYIIGHRNRDIKCYIHLSFQGGRTPT